MTAPLLRSQLVWRRGWGRPTQAVRVTDGAPIGVRDTSMELVSWWGATVAGHGREVGASLFVSSANTPGFKRKLASYMRV